VAWVTPQHSRGQVDAAGRALADSGGVGLDRDAALEVVNNWRSAHSFPLNTIQMGLRQKARSVYASALVAQRLKRVPSTIQKLQRFPTMKLSRMQDIGGCRAVVRSIGEVRGIRAAYARSRSKHRLVNEKDYID
jgi:ppGpp synthetase/RelA/SpoT-type nucleotidyltranferase